MATYSITNVLTNLTASGDTTIDSGGTATVTLSAESGYQIPIDISVSDADYEYNDATGVITLSNPTSDVVITAAALTQEERFYDDMNELADIVSEKSGIPGLKSIPEIKGAAESIQVGGDVTSVNGQTGDVTLTASDIETDSGDTVDEALANKADIDGSYEGMSVGNALISQNIAPVSEESGTIQDAPFISQGTGTANNTAIVDTSPVAKQLEKQGNTVTVIQPVTTFETATIETTSVDPAYSDANLVTSGIVWNNNSSSKWLFIVNITQITSNCKSWLRYPFISGDLSAGYNYFFVNGSNMTDVRIRLRAQSKDGETARVTIADNGVMAFDITSWDSSIITDLTANPSHFAWYYNGSLAYNTGTLENCNGRYLVCGQGRNLFDGVNDVVAIPSRAYYIYGTATITFKDANGDAIGSGTSYTNETFTTPSNCRSFGVNGSGNITISLYYSPEQGGEGYNQHYPYIAPKTYDTGAETLLAFDTKDPDGTVHRNTGSYTITGNETFSQTGSGQYYLNLGTTNWKKPSSTSVIANIKSAIGITKTYDALNVAGTTNGIALGDSSRPYILIGSIQHTNWSSYVGMIIQYELVDASKITEQGTPFSENIEINDYSYMAWLDENNELVSIPQGVKMFYPADYVLWLDTANARTNGDANSIALLTDIDDTALADRGYYKMQDLSSDFTLNANLTYGYTKLYKTGNVVTLDIKVSNTTGSAIQMNSTTSPLIVVPQSALPTQTKVFMLDNNQSMARGVLLSTNGAVTFSGSIEPSTTVYATLTYTIA